MATIRDVARMAGVSVSTVSLALNESRAVSPQTAERVRRAAEALGYAANPLAQSLKSGRSRLIGMVLGSVTNPFFARLLKGIERGALKTHHLVVVSDSDGDPKREMEILEQLNLQRVAGVILAPVGQMTDYAGWIERMRMPIVLIDHKVEGFNCDFVGADNRIASAMLTEHLLRLGHRRFAYIGGTPGLWTAEERRRGFLDTIEASGLSVDPVMMLDGRYEAEPAYDATMRLMTRAERPTAIVTANNVMAIGTLQALNDLGFRCPQEVSLVSIDDVPWGNVIRPRITVAVQPVDDMAQLACDWLLERIELAAQEAVPPRQHLFTPRLMIGESCQPPPA